MNIVVTGASSAIGDFLLARLVDADHRVYAISRNLPADNDSAVHWLSGDLSSGWWPHDIDNVTLIHLAPIWLLPEFLGTALQSGVKRVIAIGSTSIFTKTDSVTAEERHITQLLALGENSLKNECENLGVPWTLFRPTLIYGAGQDQNVTSIARMIESWGLFVMPGRGQGLRQPIHADDIASVCIAALGGCGDNQAFNISGGSTITYTEMVKKIFQAAGKKERIIHVPSALLKALVPTARLLPRFRHLTLGMLARIDTDLYFDHSAAGETFGFDPRPFLKNGRADLGI